MYKYFELQSNAIECDRMLPNASECCRTGCSPLVETNFFDIYYTPLSSQLSASLHYKHFHYTTLVCFVAHLYPRFSPLRYDRTLTRLSRFEKLVAAMWIAILILARSPPSNRLPLNERKRFRLNRPVPALVSLVTKRARETTTTKMFDLR